MMKGMIYMGAILLLWICAAADAKDVPFTGAAAGMHVCAGEAAA